MSPEDALANAENVLADPDTTQNAVDEALEALKESAEKIKTGNLIYITYDPSGGTFRGTTEPTIVECVKGTEIKIAEAPVREGYSLQYWRGSEYHPGDSYEVTEHHTFTAQWQREKETDTDDAESETTTKKSDGDESTTNSSTSSTTRATSATGRTTTTGAAFTTSGKSSESSKSVKTGDDSAYRMCLIVMIIAGASVVTAICLRKKKYMK